MSFKQLTPTFSTSPQLTQADVAQAAADGFRAIIDNRPDSEEAGQPDAAQMAAWAGQHGMAFEHIPVTKPADITDEDIAKMAEALDRLEGPVLGYCRSGTRTATLWALSQAGKLDADTIVGAAAAAGYDLSGIKSRLTAPAAATTSGEASSEASREMAGAAPSETPSAAPSETPGAASSETSGATGAPQKIYDVVIVGGGSAGIATASSLLKRRASLSIAIVEPAEDHYYQPGWTMVGAGVFTPEQTRRAMASVMPDKVTWIRQAAAGFAPESNEVMLADGSSARYRVLVAAPGLKLNWEGIPGLAETLGKNGVTSNYRYDLAPYTYKLAKGLEKGRALFSQPQMPIKCAGAPQKALYMSCDIWRKAGVLKNIEVEFHNANPTLFGVAAYVPALMAYIERYGVDLRLECKLVAVDGAARVATFERKGADGAPERYQREFDMLHAVPPQVAPDFVAKSPLAGETGFIPVDQATLRHSRYLNVYSLGDASTTPNAKTMAAARKQAPVAAVNVLATLDGREPVADYDGYGSCPLTVELGKIVFAEFGYGGKLLPTFPSWLIEGTKPSRLAWFLKDRMLPAIYWQGMLKGREWLAEPHMIDKAGGAPKA